MADSDIMIDGGCSSVIKVGGSLLDWPELPRGLTAFLEQINDRPTEPVSGVVLIAGGGPAADVVRAMDRIHHLGDVNSHRLAIRVLDWTAELLAALLPGSMVVRRPEALRSVWNRRAIPILAPGRVLEEIDAREPDPLPASWDVTSDSIAARIASHLQASSLILLKSQAVPKGTGLEDARRLGLVDPLFPQFASALGLVATVFLRDSDPALRVLHPDPSERAFHGRADEGIALRGPA
jgi:aspartokinase-like uncharacterized kinase